MCIYSILWGQSIIGLADYQILYSAAVFSFFDLIAN